MLRLLRNRWTRILLIVIAILAIYYFFRDQITGLLLKIPVLNKLVDNCIRNGGLNGYKMGKYIVDVPNVEWINKPHPSGKYGDSSPGKRFPDLVSEFGLPDALDSAKGGMAIWKKETLNRRGKCWESIYILDEQIPHTKPGPHTDFLYGEFKLDVPPNLIEDVRNLSESITYDPLKKVVTARCHAMGPVKATVLLAMYVATGIMSMEEAMDKYGDFVLATIPGSKNYDPLAENRYEGELCEYFNFYRAHNGNKTFERAKYSNEIETVDSGGEGEGEVTNEDGDTEGEVEGFTKFSNEYAFL